MSPEELRELPYDGQMERAAVEAAIRSAFAGVRLGSGVSLQQARMLNESPGGLSDAEFKALPRHEVTDDWAAITDSELVCDSLGYLDAEGLRYYLPALMLWLLDHHDDPDVPPETEMTIIGTVTAVAPFADDRSRQWRMFDTFTPEQRTAIAQYVAALPRLVSLDTERVTLVDRSIDQYWRRFLPEPEETSRTS
jgi:hypothetical protein